jgi:Ca-activated chloride channel family protein
MTFHPDSWWVLFLLPLAALPLLRLRRRSRRATVSFSALDAVAGAPPGRATRLLPLLPVLRALAVALVIVSIARPVIPNERTRTLVEGVAINLVVDRSDSMRALDFAIDGEETNRLDALKDIATRFVLGGEGFRGRASDLVGVVAFAGYADSVVPLTLDHEVVADALRQVRFPDGALEQGTAIGDAVALAVEKLVDAAERANRDGATRIASKVVILLTDGESNVGELTPQEAAQLAVSTGVRIYAVGLGREGFAPVPVRTPFGVQIQNVPVSIDEKTLTEISEATGGRYFRATDSDSLERIYETIDGLEKSSIEETKLVRYRDLAVEPPLGEGTVLPPFLALALILLAAETLLSTTLLRRLA